MHWPPGFPCALCFRGHGWQTSDALCREIAEVCLRAPDAAQRAALRCGALLIRGPGGELGMGPGSAAQREGRCTASGTLR